MRHLVLPPTLEAIPDSGCFTSEHGHVCKQMLKLLLERFCNEVSLELFNLHGKDLFNFDGYLGRRLCKKHDNMIYTYIYIYVNKDNVNKYKRRTRKKAMIKMEKHDIESTA